MKPHTTARDRLRRLAMRLEDAILKEYKNTDNCLPFQNQLYESIFIAEKLVTILQGPPDERIEKHQEE